jgi:hypothetical protein
MANFKKGIVKEITLDRDDYQELILTTGEKAFNVPQTTGLLIAGDEVMVNTTAVDRQLGTGGYHIVSANLSADNISTRSHGHIMKLRYTGLQVDTGATVEDSPEIGNKTSIEGTPVIVCGLHSQIVPAITYLKQTEPNINIVFCMSDGAALPISISKLIHSLKDKQLISNTVTFNHAFGGDYESINIYSALLVAKYKCNADVIVVSMGPGIVGTNTKFDFSGMENNYFLKAVDDLGGAPIYMLRGSLADARPRHQVLSHHSKTILEYSNQKVLISMPEAIIEKMKEHLPKNKNLEIFPVKIPKLDDVLQGFPKLSTMGRNYKDDPLIFEYSLASGVLALKLYRALIQSK